MHKYIANEIINLKRPVFENGFGDYSFIYRNTNENIQGYLSQLPIKNKDILTVASSGDHALLSLLNEAHTVETYDINHLARFYQELKLAGYQSLNYDDFTSFFFTNKGFVYEIFEKIITMPDEIDDFWQFLFDYNDDYAIIDSPLFSNFEYSFNVLKKVNPFLEKEHYQTKKIKNNLNFYHCDILNLPLILKKKYDIIMLSSIPNFVESFKDLTYFKKYLEQLSLFLKTNGLIIANYLYDINKRDNSLFKNDTLLKETFKDDIETISFNSLNDKIKDGVLIYQKK